MLVPGAGGDFAPKMRIGKSGEFLTEAQFRAEVEKCEFCREKPCREACPADVSPADFIMAVRVGAPSDYRRAAALILGANPLGGVCGALCPDRYCVQACAKAGVESPVRIPSLQAEVIRRARKLGVTPAFALAPETGRRAAVVGAGPAGLAAAALLAQNGLAVDVFERQTRAGGMVNLVPGFRFPKDVLRSDIKFLSGLGRVRIHLRTPVDDPPSLLERGFAFVIVATGLDAPLRLGIPGEERTRDWVGFLSSPARPRLAGRRVAVIGGGAVAADCAETAAGAGAAVEMICLETPGEMPLTSAEREGLLRAGVLVTGRSAAAAIRPEAGRK
ncbi:MAG: dihydropyrimidine dehydrogenase, partial [Candidatus Aminicenantes bacterium]|nr:dihydropyrimidine dehydrogenase [Candidatus Aminicenantes bacterium]